MIDFVDLFNACLYIQDHLDADLSLLFLAQTVGLSRFRFHRIFKAWRGETLHDFVTRMRMERAAFELTYPIPRSSRRSIKAIAFASGYKSLSSFSHAFSSYSTLSPREFRNRALRRKPDASRVADAVDALAPFSIRVAHEPERTIAVFETTGPGRRPDNLSQLSRLSLETPIDGERFGVELLPNVFARSRIEGDGGPRVARLGCVGVDLADWREHVRVHRSERDAPRSAIQLSAGRYAVIEGTGTLGMVYRAWRRGFDDWLASSGECPKPGRLYVRFPRRIAGCPQTIALCIPLEDLPAVPSRVRVRERDISASIAAT